MISELTSASIFQGNRYLTLSANNLHAAVTRLSARHDRRGEGVEWLGIPEERLSEPVTDLAVALENLSAANSRVPELEVIQRIAIPREKWILQ